MLGHQGVYPVWEGVAVLDHGPQAHHAAEGEAAPVVAVGSVDVQHHGHSIGVPRKFMPDFVFRKN